MSEASSSVFTSSFFDSSSMELVIQLFQPFPHISSQSSILTSSFAMLSPMFLRIAECFVVSWSMYWSRDFTCWSSTRSDRCLYTFATLPSTMLEQWRYLAMSFRSLSGSMLNRELAASITVVWTVDVDSDFKWPRMFPIFGNGGFCG